MAVKCGYIKDNGEQCKRWAVWGLNPPRCTSHRLDDGPTPSLDGLNLKRLSQYYYGGRRFYPLKRDDPQTRLAKLFAQFHFLGKGMEAAEENEDLQQLLRLTHLKTDVIIQIVQEIDEFGHTFTDDALQLAVLYVKKIQVERDEVEKKLQESSAGSLKRSPGYWAAYKFVKNYISTYHISPTYREIAEGVGFPAKNRAISYVKQLERDGFVRIIPKTSRGIRLIV